MSATLLQILAHDELKQLLQEKFGKTQLDIIDELQQRQDKITTQQQKWEQFLKQAKSKIMDGDDLTPIQVVDEITKICEYEKLIDHNKKTICQKLKEWQTNKECLAGILDKLSIVKTIPPGGLNNIEIESILQLFEDSFAGFKCYKVMTSDFMFCDVQKRFTSDTYPSQQLVNDIQKHIADVDGSGDFKKHQKFLDSHEFGKLDYSEFERLFDQNISRIGAIINTDSCQNSGLHWVAVFIDIDKGCIEMFNSTNQYFEKTNIIKNYLQYVQKELSEFLNDKVELVVNEGDIQVADNNCGVYSLLYIFCRILKIKPSLILQKLKTDKKENLVQLFKEVMFG